MQKNVWKTLRKVGCVGLKEVGGHGSQAASAIAMRVQAKKVAAGIFESKTTVGGVDEEKMDVDRLAKHGFDVAMMTTMTLDLRLATLIQDLTMTALDLHMTIVIMMALRIPAHVKLQVGREPCAITSNVTSSSLLCRFGTDVNTQSTREGAI